jgi:hypothetical protein
MKKEKHYFSLNDDLTGIKVGDWADSRPINFVDPDDGKTYMKMWPAARGFLIDVKFNPQTGRTIYKVTQKDIEAAKESGLTK